MPPFACEKMTGKCELPPLDRCHSVCEWGKDLIHTASVNTKWRRLIFADAKRLFSAASIRIATEIKMMALYDLFNTMRMPCALCLFGHIHIEVGVYAQNMLMKHRNKFSGASHAFLYTASFFCDEIPYLSQICRYIKDMGECTKVTCLVITRGIHRSKDQMLSYERKLRDLLPNKRCTSIEVVQKISYERRMKDLLPKIIYIPMEPAQKRKRDDEMIHEQKNKRQKVFKDSSK
jgi:hypothetical protein